ncbi:hypothetical protein [Kitasatospora viridis]|nr:hypothetical protein [Kitasatospora viridis]
MLEKVAQAIVRTTGRGILPGSDGEPAEEPRYWLDASAVFGAVAMVDTVAALTAGERIAPAAVPAVTASVPGGVLTSRVRELPLLAAARKEGRFSPRPRTQLPTRRRGAE